MFNIGDRVKALYCDRCARYEDGECNIVGKPATVHKHKFDYGVYNDGAMLVTDDNHRCFVNNKHIVRIGIEFEF